MLPAQDLILMRVQAARLRAEAAPNMSWWAASVPWHDHVLVDYARKHIALTEQKRKQLFQGVKTGASGRAQSFRHYANAGVERVTAAQLEESRHKSVLKPSSTFLSEHWQSQQLEYGSNQMFTTRPCPQLLCTQRARLHGLVSAAESVFTCHCVCGRKMCFSCGLDHPEQIPCTYAAHLIQRYQWLAACNTSKMLRDLVFESGLCLQPTEYLDMERRLLVSSALNQRRLARGNAVRDLVYDSMGEPDPEKDVGQGKLMSSWLHPETRDAPLETRHMLVPALDVAHIKQACEQSSTYRFLITRLAVMYRALETWELIGWVKAIAQDLHGMRNKLFSPDGPVLLLPIFSRAAAVSEPRCRQLIQELRTLLQTPRDRVKAGKPSASPMSDAAFLTAFDDLFGDPQLANEDVNPTKTFLRAYTGNLYLMEIHGGLVSLLTRLGKASYQCHECGSSLRTQDLTGQHRLGHASTMALSRKRKQMEERTQEEEDLELALALSASEAGNVAWDMETEGKTPETTSSSSSSSSSSPPSRPCFHHTCTCGIPICASGRCTCPLPDAQATAPTIELG